MLKYEPFPRLMHNLSAMALGGGSGAGIDPFIKNKQIVFYGRFDLLSRRNGSDLGFNQK